MMITSAGAPKLSKAQSKVMLWLSQGWGARLSHGCAVEINGKHVCNVDTITVLVRKGLAIRTDGGYWHATPEGKKLSPSYSEPDCAE